jgi:hypothetical protein
MIYKESLMTASTAKFNINKTAIIPIGTETYRLSVLETRKTSPLLPPLPNNLHIAQEGEATRILGGWFGNRVNSTQIWTPILDKIDKALERWAKSSPTMEGRRHIVQMFPGGMSQYLTQAQGMPQHVERRLAKRISNYIWEEKERNPVNKDVTYMKIIEGG